MCLDRQGVKHGIIWWLVQSIAGDVQLPRRKAKRQAGAGSQELVSISGKLGG